MFSETGYVLTSAQEAGRAYVGAEAYAEVPACAVSAGIISEGFYRGGFDGGNGFETAEEFHSRKPVAPAGESCFVGLYVAKRHEGLGIAAQLQEAAYLPHWNERAVGEAVGAVFRQKNVGERGARVVDRRVEKRLVVVVE